MIPPDLASLPRGTILAQPGRCGVRFYVNGCACLVPQGGAPPQYHGHAGTVEAEVCAAHVLAGRAQRKVAVPPGFRPVSEQMRAGEIGRGKKKHAPRAGASR